MMPVCPDKAGSLSNDPFRVPWTSDFVKDHFGLSMVLNVGQARQVFRWVAPACFLIGSPPDGSGQY